MKKLILSFCLLSAILAAQVPEEMLMTIKAPSGTAAYTPYATKIGYFSGSAGTAGYLTTGTAGLSGASDSGLGLFSCWMRVTNVSTSFDLLRATAGGTTLEFSWDGTRFRIRHDRADGTAVISLYTDTGLVVSNQWHHILASYDLSTAGRFKIYIDGVSKGSSLTFTVGETCAYSATNWFVLASAAHTVACKDLCEVYFSVPSTYYNLDTESNRLKFRTAGGKPENLGSDGSTPTGSQPLVYLKNAYTSFEVNSGSGGNFIRGGSGGTGYADVTPP